MKKSAPKKRGRKFNIRKKLDDLLRIQIRERDGDKCQRCGRGEGLGVSHCFPKGRYAALRWEPDNLMLLCWFCHGHWWHLHPLESGEWFRKNWPDRYERLWHLANAGEKVNPKLLYAELTGECAVCGNDFIDEILSGQSVHRARVNGMDLPVHAKCKPKSPNSGKETP